MMSTVITILLFCLMVLPAKAGEVYKWIDDNGGVHYGSSPPEGRTLETVKLEPVNAVSSGQTSDKLKGESNDFSLLTEGQQGRQSDPLKCKNARKILRELNRAGPVRTQDSGTGEYRTVSMEERNEWRSWVAADIRQYCQ